MTREDIFSRHQPDEIRVYRQTEQGDLEVHIFKPDPAFHVGPRPAIVFFFGGGWIGGSPAQFHTHCRYLALRGMVAMSAEYRVRDTHETTPAECVEDGKSCMRWIKQNADDLNIDVDRLCAGGGSAGGHVACAASFCKEFNAENDDLSIPPRAVALALFNPVADNGPDGYGYDRVMDYWETISPAHNIAEGIPPVLFMLGTEDSLITVSSAEGFKSKMEAVGARCDLKLYDDQPHGFFNFKDGNNPFFYQTLLHTDAFLQSLDILDESDLTNSLRD
jgi:acetyl esterase